MSCNKDNISQAMDRILCGITGNISSFVIVVDTDETTGVVVSGKHSSIIDMVFHIIDDQMDDCSDKEKATLCAIYMDKLRAKLLEGILCDNDEDGEEV